MADNEGEENISHEKERVPKTENEGGSRGNEWELLSASAYSSAPGPRGDELGHEDTNSSISGNEETEASRALFMSGHFAFPPNQHENLPIAPEKVDISESDQQDELVSEANVLKEGEFDGTVGERSRTDGFDVTEDEGYLSQSTHGPDFYEQTSQHGLNVDDEEQDLYDKSVGVNDLVEASNSLRDPSYQVSPASESGKEDETDDSDLPCEAWWKRGVASLCAQAKETSAFWSIVVAAAVMGLVVLGHRWQQERWQVLHQKWQLSVGDEKSGRILSRLKDMIVGGSRRGTYVTATSAER